MNSNFFDEIALENCKLHLSVILKIHTQRSKVTAVAAKKSFQKHISQYLQPSLS